MFPHIHGVLLFDSPLNGLSRSMFAYGAFTQYQNISSVFNVISAVSSSLAIGGASASTASVSSAAMGGAGAAAVASQASKWRRWQALASRTGAYGAIMAGGVAAYVHREQIYNSLSNLSMPTTKSISNINYKENISQGLTYVSRDAIGEGFAWMASHLKFVGALMKTGQLTQRLERLEKLEGVGVVNLYTSLGENGMWNGGYFVPKRTFCAVPTAKDKDIGMWREMPNPKAVNEIEAHCSMFKKEKNEGYDTILEAARTLVCEWISNDAGGVVDDYKPSREVLHRSMSETKLWDDDGKVLPIEPEEQGGSEDEKQLEAILKSADMPLPEGGDEASVMEALEVPLPVEEEVNGEKGVLGLEEAVKVPLPVDEGVAFGEGEENKEGEEKKEDGEEAKKEEKGRSAGWFRNPLPMLYGGCKEVEK